MAASLAQTEPDRTERVRAVMRTLQNYDVAQSTAWPDLDELSTHTYLDGVEVDPEGIVIEGNLFKSVVNVYVLLQYGKDNEEGFQTSDAFLARTSGHFEGDDVVVDSFVIDTSPFFEGEVE